MEENSYPFHQSIYDNDEGQFMFYLKEGKDINTKDNNDLRPLDIAVMTCNERMVRLLLNDEADDNIDVDGTVWRYAFSVQNEAIITNLLENHVTTMKGPSHPRKETVFHYAVLHRYLRAVQLLINLDRWVDTPTTDGYTPLHYAVIVNDSNIVNALLEAEAAVDAKTADGRNPLHFAVKHRSMESLVLLLQAKVDVNVPVKSSGLTALHIAVENNDVCTVNILLTHNANIKSKDKKGRSLLHVAAEYGHESMTKFLLRKELDVDEVTVDRSTPLDVALQHKNKNVAEILVENNADIYMKNGKGLSPLFMAIKYGCSDVAEKIISKKANVHEVVTDDNSSTLHFAARYCQADLVKLLLQKNVNIYLQNTYSQNALHVAAKFCDSHTVDQLLNQGLYMYVNEAALADGGSTAMHYAVENYYHGVKVISVLLRYGGNIDAVNDKYETPLHLTVKLTKYNAPNVAEELLINGADANLIADDGTTPLQWAITTTRDMGPDLQKILVKYGADVNKVNVNCDNALQMIFRHKCWPTRHIGLYLENGLVVNGLNKDGESALQTLLQKDASVFNVKELVERGASINSIRNEFGEGPLHLAIKTCSDYFTENTTKYLLEQGAKTDVVTFVGDTVIHYAIKYRLENKCISLLLDRCDVDFINAKNDGGRTALHELAAVPLQRKDYCWKRKATKLLLRRGADVNARDNNDDSPLCLAIVGDDDTMIELLLENGACLPDEHHYGGMLRDIADRQGNEHIRQMLLLKGGS